MQKNCGLIHGTMEVHHRLSNRNRKEGPFSLCSPLAPAGQMDFLLSPVEKEYDPADGKDEDGRNRKVT